MFKSAASNKSLAFKKVLFLVLVLLLLGIPASGSYFFNKELSNQNELESTTLDIELDPEDAFDPEEDISPGETQSRDFVVLNLGEDGFPYKIRTEDFSGDSDLCDALKASLTFHDESETSGTLDLDVLEFDVDSIENDDSFTLEITLPLDEDNPDLGSSTCIFNLVVDVWVDGLSPGQAYFDTESFENQITTGSFMTQIDPPTLNALQEVQDVPESTESEI